MGHRSLGQHRRERAGSIAAAVFGCPHLISAQTEPGVTLTLATAAPGLWPVLETASRRHVSRRPGSTQRAARKPKVCPCSATCARRPVVGAAHAARLHLRAGRVRARCAIAGAHVAAKSAAAPTFLTRQLPRALRCVGASSRSKPGRPGQQSWPARRGARRNPPCVTAQGNHQRCCTLRLRTTPRQIHHCNEWG